MPSSAQSGAESSARSDGLPESRFAAMDENGFRSIQEEARLAAYGRLAAKKCDEAMEEASRRAEERKRTARPKHVWWGFHYFWPKEVLEGTAEKDALDDAEFLKRVQKLMQHERVVETFSIFDVDGSGSIDAKELRPVVEMVMPNHDQVVLDEMVASLDINKDGEVDLWEFCVAIQKRTEGISEADMKMEMDEAFNLFNSSEFGGLGDGSVGEEQIRRIMQCAAGTRKQLTDDELESMLVELDKSNLSVRNGATIKLSDLRRHAAFN